MPNPFVWFLHHLESWGLLRTHGWDHTAPIIIGTIVGLLGLGLAFLVALALSMDFDERFHDNGFTLVGYRMTAAIGVVVSGALGGLLCFCVGSLVASVLCTKPLWSILGLVALGPILLIIGKIPWASVRRQLIRSVKSSRDAEKEGV